MINLYKLFYLKDQAHFITLYFPMKEHQKSVPPEIFRIQCVKVFEINKNAEISPTKSQ